MFKLPKKTTLTLSSLFVIGVMLISTIGVLAATPFTLFGTLAFDGVSTYSIGIQTFVLGLTPKCLDISGAVPLGGCPGLVGKQVVVLGDRDTLPWTANEISETAVYAGTGVVTAKTETLLTLDTINSFVLDANTVKAPFFVVNDTVKVTYKAEGLNLIAAKVELVTSAATSTYEYQEKIVSFSDTLWKVGAYDFVVDSATTKPVFYDENDTVKVTFKMTSPTTFQALSIVFVASDPASRYEYEGELTIIGDDIWHVGDYDFNMTDPDLVLPIYFAVGDTFKLEFKMVLNGAVYDFYATKILDHTVLVGDKVVSSRCVGRDPEFKIPAGILDKLGGEVNEAQIRELFCKGFGWGEIMLAFRYGGGDSAYTPEMLLALRAQGHSWGELRKRAANDTPLDQPVINGKSQNKGQPEDLGISNKPEKQDNPNKPNSPGDGNKNDDKGNNGKAYGKNK